MGKGTKELTEKMDSRLEELKAKGHELVRRVELDEPTVKSISRNAPCPCEKWAQIQAMLHESQIGGVKMPKVKTYIRTKIVQAYPQTEGEFKDSKQLRAREGLPGPAYGPEGYRVIRPDGHESWSPKEIFEAAYREVTPAEKAML